MDCPKCGQTLLKGDSKCWSCGFDSRTTQPAANEETSVQLNPKILEYAKKALSKGVSPEKVADKLRELELSDEEIGNTIKAAGGRLQPPEPQKIQLSNVKTETKRTIFQQQLQSANMNLTFKDRIIGVLKFDIRVFDDISARKPWKEIIAMGLAALLIQSAIGIMVILFMSMIMPSSQTTPFLTTLLGLGIMLVFQLALMVISFFILTGLIHFVIKRFGGRGKWSDTAVVYGYSWAWTLVLAPLSILGFIPLIGILYSLAMILVGFAILGEVILGLSRVHGISKGEAIVAVLIPIALIVIVVVIISFLLIAAIVWWQLGIFNMGSSSSNLGASTVTATGFAKIKPQLTATGMTSDGTPRMVFTNGVGAPINIRNAKIIDMNNPITSCSLSSEDFKPNPQVASGENVKLSTSATNCVIHGDVGSVYQAKVSIVYDVSVGGVTTTHIESGTLRGPMESIQNPI